MMIVYMSDKDDDVNTDAYLICTLHGIIINLKCIPWKMKNGVKQMEKWKLARAPVFEFNFKGVVKQVVLQSQVRTIIRTLAFADAYLMLVCTKNEKIAQEVYSVIHDFNACFQHDKMFIMNIYVPPIPN